MDGRTVVIPQPVVQQQAVTLPSAQNATRQSFVSTTKGLGITQIVIGILTLAFGIAVVAFLRYWAGNVGFGIWGGVWILVGGILGVVSASNPENSCLNGANMAFAIVSSVISFIQFIVYCIAISYFRSYHYCYYTYNYYYRYNCEYRSNPTGVGLFVVLLLLMIAEFSIALTVAIYCCRGAGCCGSYGTQGVVVQQSQPVVLQPGGMTTVSYPVGTNPYPNQQVSYVTTSVPNTTVMTSYSQQPYGQTFPGQASYGEQPKQAFGEPPPYAQ